MDGPRSVINADSVVARLRRRKLYSSFAVATETAILCRHVVSTYRWTHIDQLLQHLRVLGKKLVEAQPREFTSGNIVRRILKMVREIYADSLAGIDEDQEQGSKQRADSPAPYSSQSSLSVDPSTAIHSAMLNLLGRPESANSTSPTMKISSGVNESGNNLRPAIIAGIQDLMDELTRVYKDIGPHSLQQIHSSEIILTHSSSKTVASFLKQAAESRRFTVIVAESYPNDLVNSHHMAESLSQAGITTILIPDSAVFGIMSRVNKVNMAYSFFRFSDETRERIATIIEFSRVTLHYTYIPLIVYLGYTRSSPRPDLLR